MNPLEWFGEGLSVIPIESYETKKPLITYAEFYQRQQTDIEFNSVNWSNVQLFSVVCGMKAKNGYYLTVIDIDDSEDISQLSFPETYIEKTPHGFHVFYWSKTPCETIGKFSPFGFELLGSLKTCIIYNVVFQNKPIAILDNTIELFYAILQKEKLNCIRAVFHKWLIYSDETLLDICLAVRCYTEWFEIQVLYPLWFAILGASGNRKTETVSAFEGDEKTIRVDSITENTFVSGNKRFTKNDLAPKLKNKLMLTLDFAPLLSKDSRVLNQILSDLRIAYEGNFNRRTGSGVESIYTGIFFNWLLCSTSIYDRSSLIRASIGQRELIYRLEYETEYDKEIRNKKIETNTKYLEQMHSELKEGVRLYVELWRMGNFKHNEITITSETEKLIEIISEFIVYLRACAEIDTRKGEPTDFVEPEEATRVLAQLLSFCRILLTLSPRYTETNALHVISEIAKSSMNRVRYRVLKAVNESVSITATNLTKKFNISYETINAELLILAQLGFVKSEGEDGKGRKWFVPEDLKPEKQAVLDFIFPKQTIAPLKAEDFDPDKEQDEMHKRGEI